MTRPGGSIADFYDRSAGLYALLSEDRDFGAQSDVIARCVSPVHRGGRLLELFAGPARHSMELQRRHGFVCDAVDASVAMRALATGANGLAPDRYHVASLPTLPAFAKPQFHAATILRYSAGYLTVAELLRLLHGLREQLLANGRLLLELHDLDQVRADFRDLVIRDRVVTAPDGTTVRCVWPSGRLRWRASDWVVEMDVVLEVMRGGTVLHADRFVSVERIYAADEVAGLAEHIGGWTSVPIATDAFEGSRLVLLERT